LRQKINGATDSLISTGVLRTPDGNAVAATLVLVGPEGSGAVHEARCEADTGDFAFGPLPPGTYTLRLKPDDWPELAYGEVELLRDDVLDLGAWRLESPSPIELEVVGPRGSEPGLGPFEEVTLFRDRGDGVWFEPRRYARADLDELLAWPGDYVLCARGATVCSESQPLTVIAGEAARVRLEPDPGVECTLVLVPGTTPLPPRLVLSIVDAQNRSAANWSELDPGAGEQHLTRRLRPGEYTAVLRAHGGEPTRYPFRVHAPHDASRGEPVTIELPLD